MSDLIPPHDQPTDPEEPIVGEPEDLPTHTDLEGEYVAVPNIEPHLDEETVLRNMILGAIPPPEHSPVPSTPRRHLILPSIPTPISADMNPRFRMKDFDDTLQECIQNLAYLPEFADTMFDEIMLMVQGSDKAENALNETLKFDEIMLMVQGSDKAENALNETLKFDKMRRSDFNTAKDFITEYQKHYHVLSRFKIQPRPFHALSQVLRQLEKEISKVQFIIEEISNIEPKKITLKKIDQYCKSLPAVSDREGTTNAAQSTRGRGGNRGASRGERGGKKGSR
ncbi:uncharacterized protein N7518_009499 [Penicillium psychrosexuale]|uniref:uncharacterized protein n=1 Tax=Penicillium psychrosexuale TaxID=1002107 RepID=UPI0025453D2F|nr:uncharacterized protein N7518_009499 [Penicillium psychrosexuale]KAJ5783822.1 hypothetical protein N7518_009499 [Penicillium psychrosexuale]